MGFKLAHTFSSLSVLLLAVSTSAKSDPSWPNAPYGSIVAVARLVPVNQDLLVRGTMSLIWPRLNMGNASVAVNLTGALSQVTMVHIRANTTGDPIRLDLLPAYTDSSNITTAAPLTLNPPLSFRGIVSFSVPFDYLRVGAWDPDSDHMNFIQLLQLGQLYVSVRTVDWPEGALKGKLVCRSPCMFSIGGGGGVVYPGK